MNASGSGGREAAAGRGAAAEARARSELEEMGWTTLDANVTLRVGELDLVMRDGDTIVFVEVRHRSRGDVQDAATSLGPRKLARLRRAAAIWLARHGADDAAVRFDAVLYDGPWARVRRTHLRDVL